MMEHSPLIRSKRRRGKIGGVVQIRRRGVGPRLPPGAGIGTTRVGDDPVVVIDRPVGEGELFFSAGDCEPAEFVAFLFQPAPARLKRSRILFPSMLIES